MKKYFILLIMIFMFPITVCAEEYADVDANVSYDINLDIWNEQSLSTERETIKRKWINNDCGTLMYGNADVWDELTASEKRGYSRSDFNHSILTNEYLYTYEEMLNDSGYNIESSKFIDYGMKMMKFSGSATYNGYSFDYLSFITINNGYMVQWQ